MFVENNEPTNKAPEGEMCDVDLIQVPALV